MIRTAAIERPSPWLLFRGILGYGFYFVSTFLFITVFPPLMLLHSWNPAMRQRFGEKLFRKFSYFLSRVYLPMLGIYRIVEESGFENLDPAMPAVIAANHRSRMDAPYLLPVLDNTGVVIKSTYTRLPFYAALVRHLNFVSVNPNSLASLTGSMQQCKEMLGRGMRLLIFPEGTRAAGSRVGEFKDLAFRLAIEADVPVVPVVLHTSLPFMTKIRGSVFPPRTFNVTIRMLPPVNRTDGERATDFAARVRRIITAELQQLDKGTVWESLGPAAPAARQFQYGKSAAPSKSSPSAAKDAS